ncbi:MAG: glycosyltransferase [Acidobacteria bacterium]|nr:glycosyltransferase [Acidobacteriota bacterium]
MSPLPAVSVIAPSYRSQETLPGFLAALRRQTCADFETIVVDSSPDDACERIVSRGFPEVRFERAAQRLLPHAARNRGVAVSRGELLVFTDPDVYPEPDWLDRLLAAHAATGHVIAGALACHGARYVDTAVHFCKFAPFLPGGPERDLDMAPTANLLCSRAAFLRVGAFPADEMQGDVIWSWRAREVGETLRFAPAAVVHHHHFESIPAFLRERQRRGREFAALRAGYLRHGAGRDLFFLLVSALPVRLVRVLALTIGHATRAGALRRLTWTLPLVAAGHEAWLIGESVTYARRLGRQLVGAGPAGPPRS